MTTIYLIRHTQAEGNIFRIMQGHWDGDITSVGRLQIEALKERMLKEKIEAVYSSDLYRAYITAQEGIAAPRGLETVKDSRLREMNMGPWEAKFFANIERDYPEESEKFKFDSENFLWKGAESFDSVRQRMFAAIEDIAEENDGKTIAIVSHGVSNRCFLSKVLQADLSDVETVPICKNTAITKLKYEKGRFTVENKNDHAHLGELEPKKWNSIPELSDFPLDLKREAAYYCQCYEEGWRFAHGGSSKGFEPAIYLCSAMQHSAEDRNAVLRLSHGERDAGLVELAPQRGEEENIGWISLLYLNPEYRGRGCGIQALARAIVYYKNLGRQAIRLNVNPMNETAINFYKKYGFKVIDEQRDLLLLEKSLNKSFSEEL